VLGGKVVLVVNVTRIELLVADSSSLMLLLMTLLLSLELVMAIEGGASANNSLVHNLHNTLDSHQPVVKIVNPQTGICEET
jgi:hypothetical protein